MPVNIIDATYIESTNTHAIARIDGDDRWLAYCPSDSAQSYWKIRTAQIEGTLTGKTIPDAYVAPIGPTLDDVKAAKIEAIDARTQELIRAGFTWAGNQFSMSDAAQRNWIGMGTMQSLGIMQYPFPVSTVNEGVAYLQSANDLMTFLAAYATYQTNPSGPLGSGRALKALVTACETVDAVNAIVDAR